jgi:homoserine kinase type II
MAVFTPVTRGQLAHWLERYDLGELLGFEGIPSGVENSNFFVTTAAGGFVLTLFERLGFDELPFYLGLMRHLAAQGVPCPDPVADRHGALLGRLNGKPAALVTRLAGRAVSNPAPAHCAQVGALLAQMHGAAAGYETRQPNLRGLDWWSRAAPQVLPFLDPGQSALLLDELRQQRAFAVAARRLALPSGAVHADLFRDNVLFETLPDGSPRLGGVIDFYFAGIDSWMFDLAVAVNDWCIDDASGDIDLVRFAALIEAYTARRAPGDAERAAWPMMLRAGALRFWLSRLHDLHLPRPAQMITPKDPAHFERILHARRAGVPPIP